MRLLYIEHTVFHMGHPEDASRHLASTVAAALTGAGISQRQAAEQTGIALTTLSRRLAGTSPFTVTELAALAALLGTTVSSLATAAEQAAA